MGISVTQLIIILAICIAIINYRLNKFIKEKYIEHVTNGTGSTPDCSCEAISNIASLYADKTKTVMFNNVDITGKLTVNDLQTTGTTTLPSATIGNLTTTGTTTLPSAKIGNWHIRGNRIGIVGKHDIAMETQTGSHGAAVVTNYNGYISLPAYNGPTYETVGSLASIRANKISVGK